MHGSRASELQSSMGMGSEGQRSTGSELQDFIAAEVHGSRAHHALHGFRGPGLQTSMDSELQSSMSSEVQGFRAAEIHGCRGHSSMGSELPTSMG